MRDDKVQAAGVTALAIGVRAEFREPQSESLLR
jgi:hypothetical protein